MDRIGVDGMDGFEEAVNQSINQSKEGSGHVSSFLTYSKYYSISVATYRFNVETRVSE